MKIKISAYALLKAVALMCFCLLVVSCGKKKTDPLSVEKTSASPEIQTPLYPLVHLEAAYNRILTVSGHDSSYADTAVIIDGSTQTLYLVSGPQDNLHVIADYPVSTSRYGFGSERGSNKTPLGVHEIDSKYGDGAPSGMCFYDRRPTGEMAVIYSDTTNVEKDPVTSRIIWLKGRENINHTSYWRFVYIHGTHEEGLIGTPQSKGCIRMLNKDVIELFNYVTPGTMVNIILSGPDSERN